MPLAAHWWKTVMHCHRAPLFLGVLSRGSVAKDQLWGECGVLFKNADAWASFQTQIWGRAWGQNFSFFLYKIKSMPCSFQFNHSFGLCCCSPLLPGNPGWLSAPFWGAPHVLDGIWELVDKEWEFFLKSFSQFKPNMCYWRRMNDNYLL